MGDLIIDETYYVDVNRVSPEAPVVVAELTKATPSRTLGGVGMAARYAEKHKMPYGVLTSVQPKNIPLFYDMNLFPIYLEGQNVTKTRLIGNRHKYHIVRIDNDNIADQRTPTSKEVRNAIQTIKEQYDVEMVCLLNYNKGFFSEDILSEIYNNFDVPTFVDTGTNFSLFKNCDFVRMNDEEFSNYIEGINKGQEKVSDNTTIIVTGGKAGAWYFLPHSVSSTHVEISKLNKREGIPDTTGCGDIFDVSFCKKFVEEKEKSGEVYSDKIDSAVEYAVARSSEFAHEDFKTRLII